jgi:hypothetical protein
MIKNCCELFWPDFVTAERYLYHIFTNQPQNFKANRVHSSELEIVLGFMCVFYLRFRDGDSVGFGRAAGRLFRISVALKKSTFIGRSHSRNSFNESQSFVESQCDQIGKNFANWAKKFSIRQFLFKEKIAQ